MTQNIGNRPTGPGEQQPYGLYPPPNPSFSDRANRFWLRVTEGMQLSQLWNQFRTDAKSGYRHPSPAATEGFPNEFAVPLSGEEPQAHGQFLHDEQHRHQYDLQEQQPVTPLNPALRCSDDAADIRIGQHDDQTRSHDREKSFPARARGLTRYLLVGANVVQVGVPGWYVECIVVNSGAPSAPREHQCTEGRPSGHQGGCAGIGNDYRRD